jgi:hypothetical protein
LHIVGQFPSHVSPISTTMLPHVGMQLPSLFALQPAGQQPSPPVHMVIGVKVHARVHIDPVNMSAVQEFMSLHVVGQFPSHVSPISTTMFPQTGAQSSSLVWLQPGAQQPSPSTHVVIAGCVHTTLHWPAMPVSTSFVHAFPSLAHVVGQFPSHVSPISTTMFPQVVEQSSSFVELQPGAQQPSPSMHVVIAGCVHATLHDTAAPVRTSLVHVFPSSGQVVGQLPSHVSAPSTTPFPHIGVQLLSLFALQPGAQQPSPPVHIVIAGCVHTTLH